MPGHNEGMTPAIPPPLAISRAHQKIIVALDFSAWPAASAWLAARRDPPLWVKVGLELFIAAGPPAIAALKQRGHKIFLDLKLHDIPNTVAGAVRAAAAWGVDLMTVHAGGGPAMLEAAAKARSAGLRLVGVTVLTSLDQTQMAALDWPGAIQDRVVSWARLCRQAGLDGVVASAREAPAVRAALGRDFMIVTPGIRPQGVAAQDQARAVTPAEALRAGADYLVIGRPLTQAADPDTAWHDLRIEMETAIHSSDPEMP